ncbi:transport and Golgi organization protein 2 homolog [Halichondria panicea]|uniref:transport and Golgi organization protein 2 homolog n=1 Tax=Halichondria panicea TaxID=6063 RepID=UPI00312BC665
MCILCLYYSPDEGDYLLIAADNRDEVFERPTAQADFWRDHSTVLAGRDLQVPNGGTWFGVTVDGRFSVLTNFRQDPKDINPNAESRGHLVSDYLTGKTSPLDYCKQIDGQKFNGFSLITADLCGKGGVAYRSNYDPSGSRLLGPGVYGLSNSTLDSPWHKVKRGKETFADIVKSPDSNLTDRLLKLLSDDTSCWPDPAIPSAGIPEEFGRNASAIFVNPCAVPKGTYGTRTQTILTVTRGGLVSYTERTFSIETSQWNTISHTFQLCLQ